MRNLSSDTHFNNVFLCNYYNYSTIIIFTKTKKNHLKLISTGSYKQKLTKLSRNYRWSVSFKIKKNHRYRLAWYWVIRPFAHISNANLKHLCDFLIVTIVRNGPLKWDHTESTKKYSGKVEWRSNPQPSRYSHTLVPLRHDGLP